METQIVNSSIIQRVGYDITAEVLEIEFKRGDLRRYFRIPPSVFQELKTAPSVGKYFLKEIKDKYDYR